LRAYIPPFAKDGEGWGTRFVLAGERENGEGTRTTSSDAPQSSSASKDHSVWSKSLVEEFSIKISHPHLLIIILQQRPANSGVAAQWLPGTH
jgi:hypothetical protein